MSSHPSLLIFTTSQSPLAIKTPRPHKPTLNLPAIIHRSLHAALDATPASFNVSPESTIIIPHPDTLIKHDVPPNHSHPSEGVSSHPSDINVTSQPPAAGTGSAKGEELEAEITIKVHLVGSASPSKRAGWVVDALDSLHEYKGLTEVDTLLVGFKGIDYKGKRTAAADFFGCGAEGLTSDVAPAVTEQSTKDAREIWELVQENVKGRGVKQVGTLYLPLDVLKGLSQSTSSPKVNSLDTPDCHSLPKDYTEFAKENGIELWAGGGGEGSGEFKQSLPSTLIRRPLARCRSAQPLERICHRPTPEWPILEWRSSVEWRYGQW